MKNYFITLILNIGEYEKIARRIVRNAPSEEEATKYACAMESHGGGSWDDNIWWDMGGEMAYRMSGWEEVTDDECGDAARWIGVYEYDSASIDEMLED